jgi:hypothetical protein
MPISFGQGYSGRGNAAAVKYVTSGFGTRASALTPKEVAKNGSRTNE